MKKPPLEHTCIADIYPHDAKCSACEEEKAAYEAECGKALAEQAQEERERYDWERATEGQ
jgi:hypothetical protein